MVPLPAVALAARVVLCPLQTPEGEAEGAMVGLAFTVTTRDAVALQLPPLLTVTV